MMSTRESYRKASSSLKRRIKQVKKEGKATEAQLAFMNLRLARRRAGELATDFMSQTSCRPDEIRRLVWGKNIYWHSEDSSFV